MEAVIIGATGLVGSHLLENLLADPAFTKVISVVRTKLPSSNPKLEQLIFSNIDDLSSMANHLKGDVYFCCLGTTIKKAGSQESFRKIDHDAVLSFARIALSHQAKSFLVISASGASKNSKIFYNKTKGEMEEDLKALGPKSLIIFKPSLLIGKRSQKRTGEELAIKTYQFLKPFLPKGLASRAGTNVEVLARRMVLESKNSSAKLKIIEASEIT